MTKNQYKKMAKATCGSVYAAGPVLGITARHSQRMADGEQPVRPSVAKLLTALARHPEIRETINEVK